jgi:hypothetical protein
MAGTQSGTNFTLFGHQFYAIWAPTFGHQFYAFWAPIINLGAPEFDFWAPVNCTKKFTFGHQYLTFGHQYLTFGHQLFGHQFYVIWAPILCYLGTKKLKFHEN